MARVLLNATGTSDSDGSNVAVPTTNNGNHNCVIFNTSTSAVRVTITRDNAELTFSNIETGNGGFTDPGAVIGELGDDLSELNFFIQAGQAVYFHANNSNSSNTDRHFRVLEGHVQTRHATNAHEGQAIWYNTI